MTIIFIDDDETSPTCGQEVDDCPGCGVTLLAAETMNTESDEDGANNRLLERRVLVVLRRLKEEIERETGCFSEDQTYLLVDVCQVLGFDADDVTYVIGAATGLVETPLPITTIPEVIG